MNKIEQRIKLRFIKNKKLTETQKEYAKKILGKYDEDCGYCNFNLVRYLGIPFGPPGMSATITLNTD